MKKYELKNYITHKSAEVLTDVKGYSSFVYVLYYRMGELDYDLRGTNGTGEKRFNNEVSALRSAKRYITKSDN